MESSEYERFNKIAQEKKFQTKKKEKISVWQLVFVPTGEKIIHGGYALCKNEQNKHAGDKRYKIIPL